MYILHIISVKKQRPVKEVNELTHVNLIIEYWY